MATEHKYNTTAYGVMEWAKGELEHVGRIASIKDEGIQYNYALSTVFGMAHLKDALFQMVNDPDYEWKKADLLKTHDAVVRTMKHLVKDFGVDLSAVKAFNSRGVLSDLSYLTNTQEGGKRRRRSWSRKGSRKANRKNKKTRKLYY